MNPELEEQIEAAIEGDNGWHDPKDPSSATSRVMDIIRPLLEQRPPLDRILDLVKSNRALLNARQAGQEEMAAAALLCVKNATLRAETAERDALDLREQRNEAVRKGAKALGRAEKAEAAIARARKVIRNDWHAPALEYIERKEDPAGTWATVAHVCSLISAALNGEQEET